MSDIGKSLVNGKWVKASEVGVKGLRAAKANASPYRGGRFMEQRGRSAKDWQFANSVDASKDMFNGLGIPKGGVKRLKGGGQLENLEGATTRFGGKRGESRIWLRPDARPETVRHEMAHATPKRSGYRLHAQIGQNPLKSMREEARADYAGTGHYQKTRHSSTYGAVAQQQAKRDKGKLGRIGEESYQIRRQVISDYAGGKPDEAIRAYRQVHDKMSAAGHVGGKPIRLNRLDRQAIKQGGIFLTGTAATSGGVGLIQHHNNKKPVTKSMDGSDILFRRPSAKFEAIAQSAEMANRVHKHPPRAPKLRRIGGFLQRKVAPPITEPVYKALPLPATGIKPKVAIKKPGLPRPKTASKPNPIKSPAVTALSTKPAGPTGPPSANVPNNVPPPPRFGPMGSQGTLANNGGVGIGAAGARRELAKGLEMVQKSDMVQKNSPDSADVHITGILRPIKRVKRRVSA